MTTEIDRWEYLVGLDDDLAVEEACLSDWAGFIVRETDFAFAKGAYLAFILTVVAAIETHLRAEHADRQSPLAELIDRAGLTDELRADLHRLRTLRSQCVQVEPAAHDSRFLACPDLLDTQLEEEAFRAARVIREILYHYKGSKTSAADQTTARLPLRG